MNDTLILLLPEGAYDIPPGHGAHAYLPFRLAPASAPTGPTVNQPRDQGGPWAIRVEIDRVHWFLSGPYGSGGCSIAPPEYQETEEEK